MQKHETNNRKVEFMFVPVQLNIEPAKNRLILTASPPSLCLHKKVSVMDKRQNYDRKEKYIALIKISNCGRHLLHSITILPW